jgi:hypothetical protein
MRGFLFTVAGFGVGGLLAVMPGCGPPKPDTTPPGFLTIRADYLRVSDGFNTGSETIPASGFTKANQIGRDRSLRLVVSVGDSESGIASVAAGLAEIVWTCTAADGKIAQRKVATLDTRSDEERRGTAAPGTPPLRNATFLVDPFDGPPNRLICGTSSDQSPAVLSMTITVRNGAGLTASTGNLQFTWVGRPPGP